MKKSWTHLVALLLCSFAIIKTAHSQVNKSQVLLQVNGEHLRWDKPTHSETVITYTYAQSRALFVDGIAPKNCRDTQPVNDLLQRSLIEFATFHERVVKAMRSWETVANVRFEYTNEEQKADLRIAAQSVPNQIAWVNLSLTPSTGAGYRSIRKGVICLNPLLKWSTTYSSDRYRPSLESVMQHEIGHVLALDHQGKAGARMSYEYTGDTQLDQKDISAVQLLYGPRLIPQEHISATN